MRIFKLKDFARYARKADITDAMLRKAVADALAKPDANLGGEVYKQRVARSGGGKSGGYRTIILLRKGARLLRSRLRQERARQYRRERIADLQEARSALSSSASRDH